MRKPLPPHKPFCRRNNRLLTMSPYVTGNRFVHVRVFVPQRAFFTCFDLPFSFAPQNQPIVSRSLGPGGSELLDMAVSFLSTLLCIHVRE